jgi:hypothetical protein
LGAIIGDIEGGWNEICQKHHQIDGRPREIDELLKVFDRKRFLKSGTPCTSFTARIVPARGSEKNISVFRRSNPFNAHRSSGGPRVGTLG